MATQNLTSRNREQLQKLRIRTLRRALVHGLTLWLIPVLSGVLLMVWSQSGDRPDTWTFLLTLAAFLAGVGLLARDLLWAPLKHLLSNRKFALHLSRTVGLDDVLVVMEEAVRQPDKWQSPDPVNVAMRQKLHQEAARLLGQQTAEKIQPLKWVGQGRLVLLVLLAVGVFWAGQNPAGFKQGWARFWQPLPGPEVLYTQGIYIPGETIEVVAGGSLQLEGMDLASGSATTWCEIRRGQGLWQRFNATEKDPVWETPTLVPPYRLWVCDQSKVLEDFEYRFGRESIISQTGRVRVRHHPLVASLSGTIIPPAYTGLSPQDLDRVPTWLDLPEGSTLALEGTLNHPVKNARVMVAGGDTLAFALDGQKISTSFSVHTSLNFHLALVDSFGLSNEAPLQYEIVATEDQIPAVDLFRPEDDGAVPLSGLLVVKVEAGDDYGIEKADLLVRSRSGEGTGTDEDIEFFAVPFWSAGKAKTGSTATPFGNISIAPDFSELATNSRLVGELEIGIGRFDLVAGDGLEFQVRVSDNRRPLPRGQGYSEILKLFVPSAADALAEQADKQEEHRSTMEEVRKRGNQLSKDLDRLTRELMKNPVPDWARQKEMEAAIEKQKSLQEELARVAQQLQQELDNLAQSQLTSQRLMDKAEQVSQLLSSESSEQLKNLLQKMDEAAGKVSPEEVADAMKEVAREQKEMARKLDAALAMLKKMEQEQELEGMASMLEKMIAKQQELADLSREMAENGGENDPEKAEEMARRQEALEKEMDQLQEKLQDALDEMAAENAENADGKQQDPSQQEMSEALEQAMEKMKEQKSDDNMGKAAEMLEQMDPQMAAEMQQQALRDLGSLYHILLQTQSAMQMAMEQQQVTSLRKLAADLLELSQKQEDIAQRIPLQLREVRTQDLTRGQHRLQKSTIAVRNELALLAGEAPMRIMKLLKSLDSVVESMGQTVRDLEQSRGAAARRNASTSLAEANGMVISILTEAQMAGSGSGGGSQSQPSAGEKLKEMLMEQAKLNGMTQQLRDMLANRGMSQQARAEARRLGDKQGELAGKIQEMAEEQRNNPEGDRLLGDMEHLGQDMETVGQEMGDGLVSEETLIRQERILSRMLSARNAARRRDYSTKRESHTADDTFAGQDGRSADQLATDEDNPFARRYIPLEKAPAEFRELVRRYFQALEKLGRKEEMVP